MAKHYPNNTGQSGIYYSGGGGYLDVDATFNALNSDTRTFAAVATADSWANGDTVDVYVRASAGNWIIATVEWDETNEYLLVSDLQDSKGTLNDSDAVEVTASVTSSAFSLLTGFSAAKLHHGDTSLSFTSTATNLDWDGALFDVGGWWSASNPSRLTVPAGVNYVTAFVGFQTSSSASLADWWVAIRLNGATQAIYQTDNQNWGPGQPVTGPIAVSAGDYLDVRAWCSTTAAMNTDARTFFSVMAVG